MSTPTSDILIIGGGVAGLTLALEVADQLSVTLVRPALDDQGASRWAQGGIAAVLSPDDDLEAHVRDTLIAGDGLCDEEAVRHTVNNGPAAIQWLIDNGVPFTPDPDPAARYPYHLTREGGHNARRIIHADDATGRAVVDTLLSKVSAHPNIKQRSDLTILNLLSDDAGQCIGARGVDRQQRYQTLLAQHIILATGGSSGLYRHTTTPSPSSGEGMIMAAELGATLMNLEFQQFHPTCLFDPDGPAFLISEAVRGEGGHLLNEAGLRFMPDIDPRAELAPRDVVARAIDAQIQQSTLGHVWLDIRHIGEAAIRSHFPTILAHCATRGIDIIRQPIPVVPAAHYSCGGVATDYKGATNVPNLYAIGETACTGLHGANRMASNSLLECLVYARSCAHHLMMQPKAPPDGNNMTPTQPKAYAVDTETLTTLRNAMREAMSHHVSIVRSNQSLNAAQAKLSEIEEKLKEFLGNTYGHTEGAHAHPESIRLQQSLKLAQLTVLAALDRHESRGLHYSTDWPTQQAKATVSELSLHHLTPRTMA
ncbi:MULTISPECIES: L-aspartate oxidase [unclassified Halomonas]|uniref:L-aspartate oxidase n=1 Tax=unclassified Halomonas TaxID=2609666 RepID=UPI0009904E89|nr:MULTISPECIES: L-aspartate oxidase [unclassified Halomonas]AQU82961.1 L-aspartate oxidase [Halomonas sp. 'Soap Lake \